MVCEGWLLLLLIDANCCPVLLHLQNTVILGSDAIEASLIEASQILRRLGANIVDDFVEPVLVGFIR